MFQEPIFDGKHVEQRGNGLHFRRHFAPDYGPDRLLLLPNLVRVMQLAPLKTVNLPSRVQWLNGLLRQNFVFTVEIFSFSFVS